MKTFSHLKNVLNSPLNTVNNKNAIHASIDSLQETYLVCCFFLAFCFVLGIECGMEFGSWKFQIWFENFKFCHLRNSQIQSSQKFKNLVISEIRKFCHIRNSKNLSSQKFNHLTNSKFHHLGSIFITKPQ